MYHLDEIPSLNLSQGVKLRAQWQSLNKYLISQGINVFENYIMTPLSNFIYINEATNTQHICEEIFVEHFNMKIQYSIIIQNSIEIGQINLDEDYIAYLRIQIGKNRRKGNKITKFANLFYHSMQQAIFKELPQMKKISAIKGEVANLNSINYSLVNNFQQQFKQLSQEINYSQTILAQSQIHSSLASIKKLNKQAQSAQIKKQLEPLSLSIEKKNGQSYNLQYNYKDASKRTMTKMHQFDSPSNQYKNKYQTNEISQYSFKNVQKAYQFRKQKKMSISDYTMMKQSIGRSQTDIKKEKLQRSALSKFYIMINKQKFDQNNNNSKSQKSLNLLYQSNSKASLNKNKNITQKNIDKSSKRYHNYYEQDTKSLLSQKSLKSLRNTSNIYQYYKPKVQQKKNSVQKLSKDKLEKLGKIFLPPPLHLKITPKNQIVLQKSSAQKVGSQLSELTDLDKLVEYLEGLEDIGQYRLKSKDFYSNRFIDKQLLQTHKICAYYMAHQFLYLATLTKDILKQKPIKKYYYDLSVKQLNQLQINGHIDNQLQTIDYNIDQGKQLLKKCYNQCGQWFKQQQILNFDPKVNYFYRCSSSLIKQFKRTYELQIKNSSNNEMLKRCIYLIQIFGILKAFNNEYVKYYEQYQDIQDPIKHLNQYKYLLM